MTFFALALYLAIECVRDLITLARPGQSAAALAVAGAALIVMPLLAVAKRRTGHALGNGTLIADSAETAFCAPELVGARAARDQPELMEQVISCAIRLRPTPSITSQRAHHRGHRAASEINYTLSDLLGRPAGANPSSHSQAPTSAPTGNLEIPTVTSA